MFPIIQPSKLRCQMHLSSSHFLLWKCHNLPGASILSRLQVTDAPDQNRGTPQGARCSPSYPDSSCCPADRSDKGTLWIVAVKRGGEGPAGPSPMLPSLPASRPGHNDRKRPRAGQSGRRQSRGAGESSSLQPCQQPRDDEGIHPNP